MHVEFTNFQGLLLIHNKVFSDDRGHFIKNFNRQDFIKNGLDSNFEESFYSISKQGAIRGMHFQTHPFDHTKLVFVSAGRILDVVLDLRRHSKTFGKYFYIFLDNKNHLSLYIPSGFAHGFLSLENESKVHYMQTTIHSPNHDHGIHFDSFGFNWKKKANNFNSACDDFIISHRDKNFPTFQEFIKTNKF